MSHQEITDNLDALLEVLPPKLAATLQSMNQEAKLLEVVLDLGRRPEARFTDQEATLNEEEVTQEEIDRVVSHIGAFGDDNRAGIPRTLHRISAIRNRKGDIVGLTLRVGRAVYGTIDIIRDIVESGQSILLLGRPGVGKTTMLREVARVLAENKRVVIVDTSNEIGGDGDIPHPAIGRARRMQVTTPTLQHEVMIEAVENHMPEVIIIDEIGRELEAVAARTIAERGVQLVATAHGNTLDNLMMNPTLADLVGGIQSVILSDEEARRRGTQKSILERKAPPTFDAVIEIQDWYHLAVRHEVAEAVDAILRGREMPAELRYRDETGEVHMEKALLPREERGGFEPQPIRPLSPVRIYTYGVSQNYLQRASESLDLPVEVVRQLSQANLLLTTKNYYRRQSQVIQEAERRGIPTHVLRSNTAHQVKGCLTAVFGVEKRVDPFESAMQETQEAITKVLAGVSAVELSPQRAYVRRKQHEMAQEANLLSQSKGREPRRRVTIYQEEGQ